jgi:hypothetical protein
MQYTPAGGVASTTSMTLQLIPCEELTISDASEIGWLLVGIAVTLGSIGLLARAVR